MIGRTPLPGFPRWTGAHVTYATPHRVREGRLEVVGTIQLTLRARVWYAWRALTGREVNTDAAPHH